MIVGSSGTLKRPLLLSLCVHGALLLSSRTEQAVPAGGVAAGKLQVVVKPAPAGPTFDAATPAGRAGTGGGAAGPGARRLSAGEADTAPSPLQGAAGRDPEIAPSNVEDPAPTVAHDAGSPPSRREPVLPIAATPGAGAPRPGPPDTEDLRAFRLSLAVAATRYKDYPALARERGWEGVVGVRVSIDPGRSQPEVALVRSSGVALLDQAALGMIARAAKQVEIPARLQGRVLRVELPVDYRLEE